MTARTIEHYEAKRRRLRLRDRAGMFFAGSELEWVGSLQGSAGSFPDAPSRRMAMDLDGTIWARYGLGQPVTEWPGANVTELSDEDDNNLSVRGWANGQGIAQFVWIFPELREIDGFFGRYNSATISLVETSVDTTNGKDGVWLTAISDYDDSSGIDTFDSYRDEITSLALASKRSVRARGGVDNSGSETLLVQSFHIYGEIAAGETPDRLLWIDNDDDLEFAKPQDYGDVPRGSASDHVAYLHNNSSTLAANSVQITAEDLFRGSGAWYTFDDGTGFTATLSLASSISNGANSPNITIRRIIPDTEILGVHAARALVSVGSWT